MLPPGFIRASRRRTLVSTYMERQSAKIKRSYPVQYSGAITGAPVAALSLSRQSPASDPVIKHPVPERLSVRGSKAMFDTPSQQTEFSVTAVQISTLLFTAFIKITYRIRPQAGFVKGINPVTVQPGLRIYCADREKMIQACKNPIAEGDLAWIFACNSSAG